MTRWIALALGAAVLAGCERAQRPPGEASAPLPAVRVTLLYTADEHGWIEPLVENGKAAGGAAEVLAMWVAKEGHCAGPVPPGVVVPPDAPCAKPSTLALSGGDIFTGPAITTYFDGEPMAYAMRRMGYAASAFGNHEFDFGAEVFAANAARSGVRYLAANRAGPDAEHALPPFAIFDRGGARIAVVGLATDTTLSTAMASNFKGISFEREEPALDRAVHTAWAEKPDALVLIAHECPDVLAPILERHPEWHFSFVGGAHCHKLMRLEVRGVPLYAPGWRFGHYARVVLDIDRSRQVGERVEHVDASIVDVKRSVGADPYPPDPAIEALVATYRKKVDAALGEPIGYSTTGLAKDSREMAHWILDAWRAEVGADVAIANDGGIRQALPAGTITKATIWSILPFDNKLVVLRLHGRDLVADLDRAGMFATGVIKTPSGFELEGGRAIDPDATYKVVTIDFLYAGGAHSRFKQQDPNATETGIDWRVPVIAWTKKQNTTPESPLERRLVR